MTKLDAGLITSLPASDPGSAAVWGSKRINPRPQFCLCLAWSGCPSNDDDDDPDHILHGLLSGSSDTRQVTLRSRRPFVPAARNLLDNLARLGICASEWTNHKWKVEYCENVSRLCVFVPEPVSGLLGWTYPEQLGLSSTVCTGVGRFH